VAGLTSAEAETLIAGLYSKNYLQNPEVSVFVKEFTRQNVTIDGAVAKPGIYPLKGQTTLLQALANAGGQGALTDMTDVVLFRMEENERPRDQVRRHQDQKRRSAGSGACSRVT
jgi:polysaccharide export outer membrane protein